MKCPNCHYQKMGCAKDPHSVNWGYGSIYLTVECPNCRYQTQYEEEKTSTEETIEQFEKDMTSMLGLTKEGAEDFPFSDIYHMFI